MFSRLNSIVSLIQNDPLGGIIYLATFVFALLFSLILHEIAHGYVALWCGDPTAKMYGRLSLDPRKHLDPVGTVFLFALGVGWAKPVPVNPRNFKHSRRDDLFVSLAGIITNLILFVITLGISVFLMKLMVNPSSFIRFANTKAEWYSVYSCLPYYEATVRT